MRMRTSLKIFGAIVILILIFLFWGLKSVDYSPYFESEYYQEARSRLDSLTGELSQSYGKVYIGAGRESITPGMDASVEDPEAGIFRRINMAGYGDRARDNVEGIHDSLFVKAVALRVQEKTIVIIGSDILIVPPNISGEVSRRINERLGITRSQLFFTATHTHSSVGGWSDGLVGTLFAGYYNVHVVEWLVARYCRAIENAVADLRPGRLGTGYFEAPDFISNRLIGEKGKKNTEFVILMAEQDEGKRILMGAYGAHATTQGSGNMQISADYPGYWQRKLEEEYADVAVFAAAGVGSHRPEGPGEKFQRTQYIGEALADSVIRYSRKVVLSDSITLSYLSLKISLPELQIRVSRGLRLNPALSASVFPDVGDVYIQTARIGDLIWSTTPCDYSGESAIDHQNAMHAQGFNALITSFNGTYTGYVIPDKYFHYKRYESRDMSWYGPAMDPYFNEMIHRSMRKILSN